MCNIKLIDTLGKTIGYLAIPSSTLLVELEHLRAFGVARVELIKGN